MTTKARAASWGSADSLERVELAPRTGGFVRLRAGQAVRIVDIDGGQVADLFAWSAADGGEHLSAQHTRAKVDRFFPRVGESFYTDRRRPILLFEQDDTPGIHEMVIAACDPYRYEQLGVGLGHASCSENFRNQMERARFARPTMTPQSVNLFMAIPFDSDGNLSWEPAITKPGDSVTLRAQMDCVVIVSACPQDVVPINSCDPSRIGLEVLEEARA